MATNELNFFESAYARVKVSAPICKPAEEAIFKEDECLGDWTGDMNINRPISIPLWKRLFDFCCILLALPALLPLMLLIAVAIKIVAPGPIFFRQERIGLRGRRFLCLKFRSMKVGASVDVHYEHLKQLMKVDRPMTKLDSHDPRLIPLGSLFRATGLDELPQVINVLRGEMSLVGPRPCTPYEYQCYLPWHKQRLDTLPGLTGLWQVSGKNRLSFTEMVKLDIIYTRSKTLWLDIKIMWRTFAVLISQVRETRTKPNPPLQPRQEGYPSSLAHPNQKEQPDGFPFISSDYQPFAEPTNGQARIQSNTL